MNRVTSKMAFPEDLYVSFLGTFLFCFFRPTRDLFHSFRDVTIAGEGVQICTTTVTCGILSQWSSPWSCHYMFYMYDSHLVY